MSERFEDEMLVI